MKIIEEQILHENYLEINKFIKKNNEVSLMFDNINDLHILSVQEDSFNNDIKFFDEISFILSVITTIISKPRIVTKQEETVIRSELCPTIQYDSLQQTLRDSRLWKQKDLEMLPKEIYYNQTSDELATYENKFIVKLIDIIDQEINKYNQFYMSIIKTYEDDNDLLLDNNKQDEAINKIKTLDRRIRYIKATNFYKFIKKQLGDLGRIVPTNILLKNRLYNYCFKFYRKYITYEEDTDLLKEFKEYYLFLILKCLNSLEYTCLDEGKFNDNELHFRNKMFNINIINHPLGFRFVIKNRHIKNDETNHLLVLDVNNDFSGLNNELIKEKDYLTKEAINIFRICDVIINGDNFKLNPLTKNIKKEEELVLFYLKNKTQTPKVQNDLYKHICPVCKSNNLINHNDDYICEECNSVFTFFNKKPNDYIYFKKLRRR